MSLTPDPPKRGLGQMGNTARLGKRFVVSHHMDLEMLLDGLPYPYPCVTDVRMGASESPMLCCVDHQGLSDSHPSGATTFHIIVLGGTAPAPNSP
jgi:hypothetical protein